MRNLLLDRDSDPAFLAMALVLPSENWISQQMEVIDPVAIFAVRQAVSLPDRPRPDGTNCYSRYEALRINGPYRYNASDAGKRALRNSCLAYLLAPNQQWFVESDLLAQRNAAVSRQPTT